MSGLSAAVICPRQRRGLRSAAVARPRRQPCHRGRQAHEHREQPPIARGCAAPRGAPSAGGQACPQKRCSPQPAKRAIRIANIAVWIARNRCQDLLFPHPRLECWNAGRHVRWNSIIKPHQGVDFDWHKSRNAVSAVGAAHVFCQQLPRPSELLTQEASHSAVEAPACCPC